jgi:hypothetical protein
MNEIDYLSGEFTNEFLHTHANTGDRLLDEHGFLYRLTQEEIKMLVLEGPSLLFIDGLNTLNRMNRKLGLRRTEIRKSEISHRLRSTIFAA